MHPIFLDFGGFQIRYYGLMAALGFLSAAWVLHCNRRFAKLSGDQASTLLFIAIIAGVAGARIFYVVQFYNQYFRGHFWRVFRIDQGGLVFYGGFLLALAALFVYCRMRKLDLVRVFDVLTPSLCIGHVFGRIGCFLNGCCFGAPTACFFGVHYPAGSAADLRYLGGALHPVQLYEAGLNLLLFCGLSFLLRHSRRGVVMSCYLVLYGAMRFFDEFFRGDHTQRVAGLTSAQVIGLLLIPAGIAAVFYFARRENADDGTVD